MNELPTETATERKSRRLFHSVGSGGKFIILVTGKRVSPSQASLVLDKTVYEAEGVQVSDVSVIPCRLHLHPHIPPPVLPWNPSWEDCWGGTLNQD